MMSPLCLVGATASGKSAFAMALAQKCGAWILSMDSMQIYRGMDIGTAKPTLEEQNKVKHGGLDLVAPGESFDVSRYVQIAESFYREAIQAGVPLIVVGGTGLYYRALTSGLCSAPQSNPEIRQTLEALTLSELQDRLQRQDPLMWEKVDRQNPRRLQRAIEVMESTGRSLADWQKENSEPVLKEFKSVWLLRTTEEQRARIDRRVPQMFDEGWCDEVQGLLDQWGPEMAYSLSAIGYREIADVIVRGEVESSKEALISDISTRTWQYARRQLTWFRRETSLHLLELNKTMNDDIALERILKLWQE